MESTHQTPKKQPKTAIFKESEPNLANAKTGFPTTSIFSAAFSEENSSPFQLPQTVKSFRPSPGYQLNSLDTELNAGLEQYLPTPLIRWRIIRERLETEIQQLEAQLTRYESLNEPSRPMQQKIRLLTQRLQTLHEHERLVTEKLNEILWHKNWLTDYLEPMFAWIFPKQRPVAVHKSALQSGLSGLVRRVNPQQGKLMALNQKVSHLVSTMEGSLKANVVADFEVSDLVNHYDQTLKELNSLVLSIKAQPKFWIRLRLQAASFFKR